ncbi:hypothetical protein [[Phormidium] sp. ETS-05]|uniref:hypothetical protein n=1 Tax=[Phormidium] sp. ETS-05 TaxID=222819 RepID=UPI0018EF0D6C|nr:hypothetical protein [[Phormidium] sp. ETS-05]
MGGIWGRQPEPLWWLLVFKMPPTLGSAPNLEGITPDRLLPSQVRLGVTALMGGNPDSAGAECCYRGEVRMGRAEIPVFLVRWRKMERFIFIP